MAKKSKHISAKTIAVMLADLDVGYITEVSIKTLVNKYKYTELSEDMNASRFDYFSPQRKLIIEFDGAQHFKPISYFNQNIDRDMITYRDLAKINFCKLNNIKIIRFSYNTKYETAEIAIKGMLAEARFATYYVKDNIILPDYSTSLIDIDYSTLAPREEPILCDVCKREIAANKLSDFDLKDIEPVIPEKEPGLNDFIKYLETKGMLSFLKIPGNDLYVMFTYWAKENKLSMGLPSVRKFNKEIEPHLTKLGFIYESTKLRLPRDLTIYDRSVVSDQLNIPKSAFTVDRGSYWQNSKELGLANKPR